MGFIIKYYYVQNKRKSLTSITLRILHNSVNTCIHIVANHKCLVKNNVVHVSRGKVKFLLLITIYRGKSDEFFVDHNA